MTIKSVTTKKRIIQFINYKEISVAMFIRETGLKRGILDADKLESSISDIFVAKIIVTYPELNIKWLLLGKGEMIVPNTIENNKNTVEEPKHNYYKNCSNCERLKLEIEQLKNQIRLQDKLITVYEEKK